MKRDFNAELVGHARKQWVDAYWLCSKAGRGSSYWEAVQHTACAPTLEKRKARQEPRRFTGEQITGFGSFSLDQR